MSTTSFPVVAAPQWGKIYPCPMPEDPPQDLLDNLPFPEDPDPAIPPPPPMPVLVETSRYPHDEFRRRVLAVALQRLEGRLYEHLERARPDWFAFSSSTNRCRLPGCPRYEGATFREVHHLARHLQNPFHREQDKTAPFQNEEPILFTRITFSAPPGPYWNPRTRTVML